MSAIIKKLKTKKNGTEQNVYPITVLEAVVNAESNQSLDAILDKKPENVSELFNFNKYNGDINSLAVGMYVYVNGVTYENNGSESTTGTIEGWCKIKTLYKDTGYCQILQSMLFGKDLFKSNNWLYIKAEDILFILTEEEAKYLGMLSSVWGATQGGLGYTPAKFKSLCTPYYSISFSMPSDASNVALVNVYSTDGGSAMILLTRGATSAGGGGGLGSVNYLLINKSDGFSAGISNSGGTVSMSYSNVMSAYAFYC